MADEVEQPQPVVTTTEHQGSMTVQKDGKPHKLPITIVKVETRHPDGRVDCTLKVPPLRMGVKRKQ